MYTYEKTILTTYKQTEAFIKSTRLAMQRGVHSSYYSRRPTVDLAEEILDLKMQLEEIEELKNAIDESLAEIKPCYAYLLKVRFGIEDGEREKTEKDSKFYRMVAYALQKFVSSMRKRGFNGLVFEQLIEKYCHLKSAYKQISSFETRVKSCGKLRNKGKSLKDKKVTKESFRC